MGTSVRTFGVEAFAATIDDAIVLVSDHLHLVGSAVCWTAHRETNFGLGLVLWFGLSIFAF